MPLLVFSTRKLGYGSMIVAKSEDPTDGFDSATRLAHLRLDTRLFTKRLVYL